MSSYDQNLLGEAPKATRAQLQEGYNVDLLEQPSEPARRTPSLRSPTPHAAHPGPAAIAVPLTPAIAENSSGEKFDTLAPLPTPTPKVSFWRTRNGILALTVLALVVVGAVVGGAVGGTVGNKSSNNKAVAAPSTTTSTTTSPTTESAAAPSTSTPVNQGAGSQTSLTQQFAQGTTRPAGFVPTTTATNTSAGKATVPTTSGGNNIGR